MDGSGTSTLSQWVTSISTSQTSPNNVTNSVKIVIDVDGINGPNNVTQTIWLENVSMSLSNTLGGELTALKNAGILIA